MGRSGYFSVKVPPLLLREMDELVKRGLFRSRSELVRFAVLFLLMELKREERRLELALR
ncbi:MAG: ribbon-helix-helix domain-containing protein [Thermofilum sp.]|nr:ribbon-helix-helix domain-containing protein [Thermofilum sp.]